MAGSGTPLQRHGHHTFILGGRVWFWGGRTHLPVPPTQWLNTESGTYGTVGPGVPVNQHIGPIPVWPWHALSIACQVGTAVYALIRRSASFGQHTVVLFSSSCDGGEPLSKWEPVKARRSLQLPKTGFHQLGYLVAKGRESLVLFTVGYQQPGSALCVFDLSKKVWFDPYVTSSVKPPFMDGASLTSVDELRAVLFGGGLPETNKAYLLDMAEWGWSEIATTSPLRPPPRSHHSASLLSSSSHPHLLVVGGLTPADQSQDNFTHSDAWLLDLESELWRKVDVPAAIAARCEHTVTVCGSADQVVVYGGIGPKGRILAQPALLEVTVGKSACVQCPSQYQLTHCT